MEVIGPIRIALGEAEFRDLVAGRVATAKAANGLSVQIILSDIGWPLMRQAIADAHITAPAGRCMSGLPCWRRPKDALFARCHGNGADRIGSPRRYEGEQT